MFSKMDDKKSKKRVPRRQDETLNRPPKIQYKTGEKEGAQKVIALSDTKKERDRQLLMDKLHKDGFLD